MHLFVWFYLLSICWNCLQRYVVSSISLSYNLGLLFLKNISFAEINPFYSTSLALNVM